MSRKSTITIPNTKRAKIIVESRRTLAKSGKEIPHKQLIDYLRKVEDISEVIVDEMIGSKNNYLIDLANELGDNRQ